ncbi:16S rRNA (guanine(527)-N(7))-methyltransferase RsmG [Clavibacter michiganensis]|uniref:Ribosomal RNA small subunit methyltransferase G n=1 Tax=Clavibacter michiganensis subsp. insidiosus TaxID=33014 RepID=A0A0D5CM10_9MICO|nr:16S rRNA (guanine(527)-N(7))-methyltransferase RsmG [Clavibacter michiganensis]AJW80305.1 16S rRNA methyltransferase [Clavibacter michiganensis subsp. insidiosus]AWF99805.1 16S rRNA methyltransferase G [Clavibacter michiganensis subsp. insidiosus]AWG02909.1 16S rRNA methyltransferase G [Clavibacter michiganensis subsp. insidiosus]OQJ58685.1 16S rRNA methyltransferase G [Clavibacter michiganensis subsp. insidiosus]RII88965.1 16S rRNA (guanine(527)-N(7))-methyltransferase RsmG [Clavibacter mi
MPEHTTVESEPQVARSLFGDRMPIAQEFASQLGSRGEELGLIGPLEPPRLWTRHIINSVLVAPLLAPGLVGDIGTGAGLPGLVLAIARSDVEFVLIEPMERRVAWLEEQVAHLGLQNVKVRRARAEDVANEFSLDQVTARAVSAFSKLIPLTVPLVKTGGELVLMKGANAEREVEAASKAIRKYHLEDVEVITLGSGQVDEVTRVIRARVA